MGFLDSVGKYLDETFPKAQKVEALKGARPPAAYSPSSGAAMDLRYLGIVAERAYSDSPEALSGFRVVRVQDGKPTSRVVFPSTGMYRKCVVAGTSFQTRERAHLVKNDGVVFGTFFDADVEVVSIQGALFSTPGDPWDTSMLVLWENLLRATKLAQIGAILEFHSNGVLYYGYPISFAYASSATVQSFVNFQMQIAIWRKVVPEKLKDLDKDVADIVSNPPKPEKIDRTLDGVTTDMMKEWVAETDKLVQTKLPEINLPVRGN